MLVYYFNLSCQKTLRLAFNTIFDYKITFVNSHTTPTIYKVFVVFPGYIDKDIGFFNYIRGM